RVDGLRLRVGAGGAIQRGEIVERDGRVRVLGAQPFLANRQRSLVQRLRLRVGARATIQLGEIVERGGGVRVFGTEDFLANCQRTLGKRNSFAVLSLTIEL